MNCHETYQPPTHPALQLFPALAKPIEDALRESIRRFGVLVPVVRDQHGRTLDGHHRARIADELGVPYRVDVIVVESDEQARDIATTLNADRRQLDPEQRRAVVAALRQQGHSTRAIAGALGVSHMTVMRDAKGVTRVTPETVTGRDGKSYPAKRPPVVAAKNPREAERAQEALSTTALPDVPVLDVRRVERLRREQAAERKRAEPVAAVTRADMIEIHHGDFRAVLPTLDIAGAVVVTDPPYPQEYLPEWAEMARLTLAGGCSMLVAMCGQAILPDVLRAVLDQEADGERWRYRWCAAYLTSGPATRVWHAAVGTQWKPIVVFDREDAERDFLTVDVFRSSGNDKQHHHWGQNEDGIAQLVEAFTAPGDLVVDPFLGGGTTAVACKRLGRRFIGCDVDAAAIATARERVA